MSRAVRAMITLALVPLCAVCSPTEDDGDDDATVAPPNCASVTSFGNGQICSVGAPALTECGAASGRICANGWLCFDGAEFAFCSCTLDSDCTSRADYINKARALKKIAPLGAKCVLGRCAGAP